jgi:hypothetical protein
VRFITPTLNPSAILLGGNAVATCVDTFVTIQETSPKGAGYCTQAAEASDNPGYNVDADPAPPLRKVVIAVGGAC